MYSLLFKAISAPHPTAMQCFKIQASTPEMPIIKNPEMVLLGCCHRFDKASVRIGNNDLYPTHKSSPPLQPTTQKSFSASFIFLLANTGFGAFLIIEVKISE